MSTIQPIPTALLTTFTNVDNYINKNLLPQDSIQTATLKANTSAGLDEIDVAPNQGHMLYQLAKMSRSRRILEVGTLGGYSAIWFARAVTFANGTDKSSKDDAQKGKVVTLEIDPHHAAVATSNIANAGFSEVVDVLLGPALATLSSFNPPGDDSQTTEPFDFAFIDADKENNVGYFQHALRLCRPGAVIVVDNVVRRGRIVEEEEGKLDKAVIGTKKLFELVGDFVNQGKVEASAVQTVGSKGWDGFMIITVL